jgi:hypothetical protein
LNLQVSSARAQGSSAAENGNKGTREIRVILYAKADSFCATALADELSVEDILAIEHDVIPLDGANVFK